MNSQKKREEYHMFIIENRKLYQLAEHSPSIDKEKNA